jgi:glycosyltransferase involved in cell wall biosynthesis
MKILHVTCGISGGARLAADRLNRAQIMSGYESKLLTLESHDPYSRTNIISKSIRKASTATQKLVTKSEFGVFSTFSKSSIYFSKIEDSKFDIVHIHNWMNLLDLKDFLRLSKISKLVFTLHDERLFTGGCHNTLNCKRFEFNCTNCPGVWAGKKIVAKNRVNLADVFQNTGNYAVTSPSSWLLNKFKQHPIIQNAFFSGSIPNVTYELGSTDSTNFKTFKKWELVFISANINDPKKGLNSLLLALGKIDLSKFPFHLNIVGKGQMPIKCSFPFTSHGYLTQNQIKDLLKSTNLCVVPSTSENLPNVIVESMLNKNLVLASNVGGISEIVKPEKTGFLADSDPESIYLGLLNIFNKDLNYLERIVQEAFNLVSDKYSSIKIIDSYNNLYTNLLNK